MADSKTTLTWLLKDEVSGPAKKIDGALGKAADKGKGFGSIMKGVGAGIGIGAFNLATAAVDTLVNSLGDMRKAYQEDQVSQTNLSNVLKNTIPNWDGNRKGVEAYAAAQAKLGFTDDEVRNSIGQLVGITHDLGKAQELNTLAQDLARAKNIDLATATDIVTKAAQGNGKALKGLGVDISGATDAAGLLDAVQQNVKGSAEAWAATSTGKTAVSQVKVGEAMEKIGGIIDKVAVVVIPMLADAFVFVADVVAKVFPYVEKVIKALLPVMQVVFGAIGGLISGVVTAFTGMARVIKAVWDGVTSAIKSAINFVIGIINSAIRGINRIQVHISVGPVSYDFNGLNLKQLPYLHRGGVVPGVPGSDQLAVLQAGETVIPRGGSGGLVPVEIPIIVDGREIARVVDDRLYLMALTAGSSLSRS